MKYVLSLLIPLILVHQSGFTQVNSFAKPYEIKAAKDVPLLSISAGMLGYSFLLKKKKNIYSEEEIGKLNASTINRFDRSATRNWSPKAAKLSDAFLFSSIAIPALLIINRPVSKQYGKVALIGVETFLVNLSLTSFTKEMVKRKRPYMYNPNAPMHRKMEADATSSFFSGHTSVSASMMFFMAKSYADHNPGSDLRPLVWTTSAVIPAITGLLRWKAGKHFWTDILTGYLVGATVGILVPALHNKNFGIN